MKYLLLLLLACGPAPEAPDRIPGECHALLDHTLSEAFFTLGMAYEGWCDDGSDPRLKLEPLTGVVDKCDYLDPDTRVCMAHWSMDKHRDCEGRFVVANNSVSAGAAKICASTIVSK